MQLFIALALLGVLSGAWLMSQYVTRAFSPREYPAADQPSELEQRGDSLKAA